MSEPNQRPLPNARWRRVLTAVDGLDVGFAVAVAMIAAGLVMLWGLAVALLCTGALGLAGAVALLVRSDAAASRSDR